MTSSPLRRDGRPSGAPTGALSLDGISVSFGGVPALAEATLSVEPGERIAVVGASGAGKTTLFRALTRSVALSGGRVTVGGRDLYSLPARKLKEARRGVGSIHQAYNLVPQLPVGVNVALGEVGGMGAWGTLKTFMRGPDADLSARAVEALERVGLGEKARARTADLSGGQQQRVAVARLLVQRPALILADEPFAAVDPVTTERVLGALLELNRHGATLLVNLHDVEMARRFPRVVALREGRIVFDGPPEKLSEGTLRNVYAGDDPYSGPALEPTVTHPQAPVVPLTEGRDGVSAH